MYRIRTSSLALWLLASVLFGGGPACSFENDECLVCHEELEVELPSGATETWTFDLKAFEKSVHGEAEMACEDCHTGIEDLPHDEDLPEVDCSSCHEDVAEIYRKSLHGLSVAKNDPLAPHCWDCHGKHDILPRSDHSSKINPINVPSTCGSCHAEDAPVARQRNVVQHNILQNYTQSIHGEGILRKGLTVTAVCTSCHTAHNVLPHTDPDSTINPENIVATCMKCHGLIEDVHRKVIKGEIWEKEPEKVPVCIDCHQPHEIRKVYYEEGVSDRDCMLCHAQPVQGATHQIPAVDLDLLGGSTHSQVRCAQCHTGADPRLERPCETVGSRVDCSICHAEQVEDYDRSIHGQLAVKGDPDAPTCLDCHRGHGTQSKNDPKSPTFSRNVPELCAKCHREGEPAAVRQHSTEHEIIRHYTMSIHGKGLLESGLLVTAICTDCHTPHRILPKKDPDSSVNPANVPDTCGKCHDGIEEKFRQSIHSPLVTETDKELPICTDCHSAHVIARTDKADFKLNMMQTCGRCHMDVAETYFETYHGKVSKLGSAGAAKCHDCHGAHDILPVNDPRSHLSHDNIVETCGKCHPGSHRQFAGYLTHATHHDPVKYPILYWTFWFMTGLLVFTFCFFGLHTLIWIPRAFVEKRKKEALETNGDKRLVKRFDRISRQIHFVMILSFFGLALTGMTLKFSYMPWAQWLSNLLGGFAVAGIIHRTCAVIMFLDFGVHISHILSRKRRAGLSWKEMLTGSRTLVPTWRDVVEFYQSIRWFLRLGPRPEYGKFTYWEKFDYFAVFWGITIIGSTGLILWFPEFFTLFLPGWIINVATIIHSDEALLAVGFIFTIHFFNTHFRPDKFPMDLVMFTGTMTVEELKRDKPGLYKELVESGELETLISDPPGKEFVFWARVFGTIALTVGLTLAVFIVWSMIFGYR